MISPDRALAEAVDLPRVSRSGLSESGVRPYESRLLGNDRSQTLNNFQLVPASLTSR